MRTRPYWQKRQRGFEDPKEHKWSDHQANGVKHGDAGQVTVDDPEMNKWKTPKYYVSRRRYRVYRQEKSRPRDRSVHVRQQRCGLG